MDDDLDVQKLAAWQLQLGNLLEELGVTSVGSSAYAQDVPGAMLANQLSVECYSLFAALELHDVADLQAELATMTITPHMLAGTMVLCVPFAELLCLVPLSRAPALEALRRTLLDEFFPVTRGQAAHLPVPSNVLALTPPRHQQAKAADAASDGSEVARRAETPLDRMLATPPLHPEPRGDEAPVPMGARRYEESGHVWEIKPVAEEGTCQLSGGTGTCGQPACWHATYQRPSGKVRSWLLCDPHGRVFEASHHLAGQEPR